jgi:hypothetical protein
MELGTKSVIEVHDWRIANSLAASDILSGWGQLANALTSLPKKKRYRCKESVGFDANACCFRLAARSATYAGAIVRGRPVADAVDRQAVDGVAVPDLPRMARIQDGCAINRERGWRLMRLIPERTTQWILLWNQVG